MTHNKTPMPIVEPIEQSFIGMSFFAMIWARLRYKRQWRLVEDYIFFCPITNEMLRVPKEFIMDFASIPFFLRWIPGLSKTGILLRNSVPHDFLYRHGFLFVGETTERRVFGGQKSADIIFRDYGILSTGARFTNHLAYCMLRVFGRFNYKPKSYVASK